MFSDGAAVRFGWETFKNNVGFIIGAMVVAMIAVMIPLGITTVLAKASEFLSFIGILLYYVVALVIGIGMTKIMLMLVDGETPSIGDLFSHWDLILKYLGVIILYGLIVVGGIFLFVIPGIYWAVKFYFAQMLVVDKGLGPVEALKRSAEITDGVKWDLVGFLSVMGLVIMIGYIALFVGILVSMPVAMIALVYVYRQLEKQTSNSTPQHTAAMPEQPAQ